MIRRLLLVLLIAAAGAGGAYLWLDARATVGGLPRIDREDPAPGSPPLVWVAGSLIEISASSLEVREGGGPTVRIRRFAEGATRFFQPVPGEWRRLDDAQVEGIEPGRAVCIEALLDGQRLLALRVFLDARCAPVPP